MYRIWLSVFGAGYLPLMPGTWGSAVVAVVFLLTALLSGSPIVAAVMLAVAIHGFVVTVAYGNQFIEKYGPDPGQIVSDEQCGQAVTFLWLWPIATWGAKETIIFTLTGFLLFRVFDIIKTLKPSARGEYEITDVNNFYVKEGTVTYEKLKKAWFDVGTIEARHEACKFIASSSHLWKKRLRF